MNRSFFICDLHHFKGSKPKNRRKNGNKNFHTTSRYLYMLYLMLLKKYMRLSREDPLQDILIPTFMLRNFVLLRLNGYSQTCHLRICSVEIPRQNFQSPQKYHILAYPYNVFTLVVLPIIKFRLRHFFTKLSSEHVSYGIFFVLSGFNPI